MRVAGVTDREWHFRTALATDPDDPLTQTMWVALYESGEFDAAFDLLERAIGVGSH